MACTYALRSQDLHVVCDSSGVPVVEFTQSDLAAGSVYYVHTSTSEMYMDRFIFAVTDGTNEVSHRGFSWWIVISWVIANT